jgi:hypothetical protein
MKRGHDRRKVERRAGKRGVTVRIGDEHPEDTKRVRRGRLDRERETKRR